MLSDEKLRLMIRLSDYEQDKGKRDLERTKFFKMDFIRLQILKTLVSVTVALLLVVLLISMYNMEYLISNALELDYGGMARYFLIIYILILSFFSLVTISVSSIQYETSKNRVREYYSDLQELLDYYDREERESVKEEITL